MKKLFVVSLMLFVIVAVAGCSAPVAQESTVSPVDSAPVSAPVVEAPVVDVPDSSVSEVSSSEPASAPVGGSVDMRKEISIEGFAFDAKTVTVPKGATVIWTNKDSVRHNVLSDSGSELRSDLLAQGESYSHTFDVAGTYTYHCGPHPNMKATVIVE